MRKISRRTFVSAAGLTAAGFALGFAAKNLVLSTPTPPTLAPVTIPADALRRLMDGNERYAAGDSIHPNLSQERRAEVS